MLPENIEEQPTLPKQSWSGIFIALALVLVVILISQYAMHNPGAKSQAQKRQAKRFLAIKSGDMAVRLALSKTFGSSRSVDQADLVQRIVQDYSKGLPDDSLELRIVVAETIFAGSAKKSPILAPKGLPNRNIWQEILSSQKLPQTRIKVYMEAVDRARLGPLRLPVMSLVYKKSGNQSQAELFMQQARQEATERSALLGIGVMLVILASTVGVAFLVLGFVYIKKLPAIKINDIRPNALAFIRYLLAYFGASFVLKTVSIIHIKSDLMFPVGMLVFQLIAFSQLDMSVLKSRFKLTEHWAILAVFGIGGSLAALPVHFLTVFISRIFFQEPPQVDSFILYLSSGGLTTAIMILVIVIVGPFVEEVAFRGVLLDTLQEKMSFWPAALVSSVAFSLLHGSFAFKFIPIFFFGMILCYLRRKTGSLYSSYAAHMCNNAIVTGLFFLT